MNDIIEKAINGDKEAFIEAVDKCTPTLYKLGYKLGMNDEDTGDAMQDTILSAYEKISTLKNPQYFKTWLIRIFINRCNSIRKKNKKIISIDSIKEQLSSHVKSHNDNLELNEAINNLSYDYKTVIVLYYIMGFTIKEMCSILDKKEGTIKSQLSRARNELRKYYTISEEA